MEKKLLKLAIASVLATVIPVRLNAAKLIYSSGCMCENRNEYYVAEINKDNFRAFKNSSKTFCGVKSKAGVYIEDFLGGDIFCGCIHRIGSKVNTNENTNNRDSNLLKKGFYTTSKILAGLWSIWGAWNNVNAILNYLGDKLKIDLGDLDINFEGVL